jgi:DNA-directed RNA polymerase subunit E'/Rpb7
MTSPYINTVLDAYVTIEPKQMNNRIYKNIKENLIKKVEKKCYKDYGYISKIFEITKMSEAIINPDIPTGGAMMKASFSCRLCHPLKNKQLICKIVKINHMLINAQNGPITAIIATNTLNSNIFFQDYKENKLMAKVGNKTIEVTQGTFVKLTIQSKTFNDKDSVILVTGTIDEVVTDDKEIKNSYEDEFRYDEENVKFDSYVK